MRCEGKFFMITAKERIEKAKPQKERLEKMRDIFLVIGENPNVETEDRAKAIFSAFEIEKLLIEDKFLI